MRIGIVIQGPLTYKEEMLAHYSGLDNICWSTWQSEGETEIREVSFSMPVLYSGKPWAGPGNLNLQMKSTREGVDHFMRMEEQPLNHKIDYVFKIRQDVLLPLDIFQGEWWKKLNPEKPSFLAWHNNNGGYLVDYVFGGPIQFMHDLCQLEVGQVTAANKKGWNAEKWITNRVKSLGFTEIDWLLPKFKNSHWFDRPHTDIVKHLRQELCENEEQGKYQLKAKI